MSRVNTDARLPQSDDVRTLKQRLYDTHREVTTQLNAISEGALVGSSNAVSAVPTAGAYAAGDFVRNSAPAELGTAGSKYLVFGWCCVTAPLTFVPLRFLTGN